MIEGMKKELKVLIRLFRIRIPHSILVYRFTTHLFHTHSAHSQYTHTFINIQISQSHHSATEKSNKRPVVITAESGMTLDSSWLVLDEPLR